MSSDRREYDRGGDQKYRDMSRASRESFEEDRGESFHSDGKRGSSFPRNQEAHVSRNSAGSMSSWSPFDDHAKERHRQRREEERQGRSRYSEESSGKQSHSYSERSPPDSPEKKRKMSETLDERDKQSSHSSSGSRKRSHSEKSPQYSSEKRKMSAETAEVDAVKREKPHEKSEEKHYSKKESYHSFSSSRKRSHSPSSSTERERKTSGERRFKIPKKERRDEDLREKTDKKPDRREEERKSSEASKSTSKKERPITSSELKNEIKDLLRTEHHHLMNRGKKDENGDFQGVEWCYKYLDPDIKGHITGGRAILHHRCRQCNRICLHLLGKYGTGKRMCLVCAARDRGWREKEVPSWYFHEEAECSNCRKSKYDYPYGGGYNSFYYGSRY